MSREQQRSGLVRVRFELDPTDWHGTATEGLWAEPVGGNRYRLRNVPFYAFGVSEGDIVFAAERDGQLFFQGVSIRGGHSTYRIFLVPGADYEPWWSPLEKIGCSYERSTVLAVDVPPSTDIYEAYELLEAGLDAGVWEFEEGHCGHPLREDSP